MAHSNTLRLLLISFYVIVTVNVAFSLRNLAPLPQPGSSASIAPAPAPKRYKTLASVPSPSKAPTNKISFPPSSSVAGSPAPSPASAPISTLVKTSAGSIDPKLKTICSGTDHPELCAETVLPSLKGEISPKKVLEINMNATTSYAKSGIVLVNKIAALPGTAEALLSALHECKESYSDAMFNLKKASSAFVEKDLGTVQTMLSAVITDVGDCEDQLKEVSSESEIAAFAEKLTNLTSNSLAIIEKLPAL